MMRKHYNPIVLLPLFIVFVSIISAQVPQIINYQTILRDKDGTLLNSEDLKVEFFIYNQSAEGEPLWSEIQNAKVTNGMLNVYLGSVNPIPYYVFDGKPKFFTLQVESDNEMAPRIQLGSVGYALHATHADSLGGKSADQFVQIGQDSSISSQMVHENAITTEKILPDIVSSINNVKNDGDNINFVAGDNIKIEADDENNQIKISATGTASGDITSVTAGLGLKGGGTFGDVELSLATPLNLQDSTSGYIFRTRNKFANTLVTLAESEFAVNAYSPEANCWLASPYFGLKAHHSKTGNICDLATDKFAVYGESNEGYAGYFEGDVHITGELTGVDVGGITSVTAGLGLEGGGTSGDVELSVSVPLVLPDSIYAFDMKTGSYAYIGGSKFAIYGENKSSNSTVKLATLGEGVRAYYGKSSALGTSGVLASSVHGVYGENLRATTYGHLGGDNYAVYGMKAPSGNWGYLGGDSVAVYGRGDKWAGYFWGDVYIKGRILGDAVANFGDVTSVIAGDGLLGGGIGGDVTLRVKTGTGLTISEDKAVELKTSYTDNRYVNVGQLNSITSPMIMENAITADKMASNAIGSAEVIDGSLTAADLSFDVISSLEGVSNNGGNIDLVPGENITIEADDKNNKITISAAAQASGDITAVTASTGLEGGGTEGDVELSIAVPLSLPGRIEGFSSQNGNRGFIGGNDFGAYGKHQGSGNEGHLGGSLYSVYGKSASGFAGYFDGNVHINGALTGPNVGDITAVNASTGLEGGGTEGDVELKIQVPLSLLGRIEGISSQNGNNGYIGGDDYGAFGKQQSSATFGYLGGEYGVYGESMPELTGNWGYIGSGDYGVYGQYGKTYPKSTFRGNSWGALGSLSSGVQGSYQDSDGSYEVGYFGALGHSLAGVYGKDINSNHGYIGHTLYGVYGEFGEKSGIYGYLGNKDYGAYGTHSSGNFGYLGSNSYGVYGFSSSGFAGYFDGNVHINGALTGVNIGDITAVTASTGLEGGGTQGDVQLRIQVPLSLPGRIEGISSQTGNNGYIGGDDVGAYGKHFGSGNYGHFGSNLYGVYGKSTSGHAGYFDGNVHINGALTGVNIGDITTVSAGNGLTGGGTQGDVTLNVEAGTGITVSANQVALNTLYTDGLYVNEGQANSITSVMIADNQISNNDLTNDAVGSAQVINNSLTATDLAVNVISSLNDVTNDGGNVNLVAGDNISIQANDVTDQITISSTAAGGDITGVTAGAGLTGGGSTGDVTLAVGAGLGLYVYDNSVALNTTFTDERYINEGQANSVSNAMIINEAISSSKVLDNSLTANDLAVHVISSLEGVSNHGGNIDLVPGSNINITSNDANNQITISATGGTGDITAVTAGVGLDGGGTAGAVELRVEVPLVLNGAIQGADGPAGNYGQLGVADYGVLGANVDGDSWGVLGMEGAGVFGKDDTFENYGYLAGQIYSVYGQNKNGNKGFFASSTRGVQGQHNNGNWGTLGEATYGVYGVNGNGNLGGFGSPSVGAYAKHSNGNYGYIGTTEEGVKGEYKASGNWGHLGCDNYGACAYNGTSGTEAHLAGATSAAWFDGNVDVYGNLTKWSGAFVIDHPLDPANKYLYHSFVESPDMKNVYDGIVLLDENGEAYVNLPDWFDELNKDFRYQLTCIGGYAPVYIAEEITNDQFKISGGMAGMKISWQVTGIRKDVYANAHRIQVEVEKSGADQGKYLHPKEYGVSENMGIGYQKSYKKVTQEKVQTDRAQEILIKEVDKTGGDPKNINNESVKRIENLSY